jgi:hypothetical protein
MKSVDKKVSSQSKVTNPKMKNIINQSLKNIRKLGQKVKCLQVKKIKMVK